MNDKIEITALANAGVLLRYRGCSLLVDALQNSEQVPFSGLPENVWEDALAGKPPFTQVTALLFTHRHPDHFSESMTREYLERYPHTRLFLPGDFPANGSDAERPSRTVQAVRPDREEELAPHLIGPDVTVQAFRTRHLDKRYYSVPHFCYLLSFGQKHVLMTGDIDYTHETLSQISGIRLDAAFVTPLFFRALSARQFFKGELSPGTLFINHIPDAADDTLCFGHMVQRDLSSWTGKGKAVACSEMYQEFSL